MAIPATQLKNGMILLHNDKPHRVVSKQHVTPGKGNAVVQANVQNLETGAIFQIRFRSSETVDPVRLEQHELQFSYQQGDDSVFMNQESFEMITLDKDSLGDNAKYLQPEIVIQASYFNGKVVAIEVPMTLVFEIVETDPALKGATAGGGPKPAVLDNGMTIKVPQHLSVGDKVKVDTRDDSFIEKA